MCDILSVNGQNKEVKFIEVNNEKKKVSLYFTDFTFISLEDVKIINKGNDDSWN